MSRFASLDVQIRNARTCEPRGCSRGALAREVSFPVEWLIVAAVMAAAMLGFRLVLMLAMLPQVSLGQTMIQLIASILCYPLVVGASRMILGVRKPATGEVDAYGRRM